ncbi:MAG: DUF6268 family outer membrane beta-barrel protein [Planctomycetota bacterium]
MTRNGIPLVTLASLLLFLSPAAGQETRREEGSSRAPLAATSDHPETRPRGSLRSFRPRIELGNEWLSRASGVELHTVEAQAKLPLYPWFGPPPPAITFGFGYTDLASSHAELPSELYAYSTSLAWLRPIDDVWTLRLQAGVTLATDGDNLTSDAWQFRGSALAIYQRNPELQWVLGLVALPQRGIPVLPAVGVTWQPSPDLRVDLVMPRPRVTTLVAQTSHGQHWGFVGLELGGNTWGVERPNGADERLKYSDWRAVIGWEMKPHPPDVGPPAPGGFSAQLQLGYAFSRELEFDGRGEDRRLSDALLLSLRLSF